MSRVCTQLKWLSSSAHSKKIEIENIQSLARQNGQTFQMGAALTTSGNLAAIHLNLSNEISYCLSEIPYPAMKEKLEGIQTCLATLPTKNLGADSGNLQRSLGWFQEEFLSISDMLESLTQNCEARLVAYQDKILKAVKEHTDASAIPHDERNNPDLSDSLKQESTSNHHQILLFQQELAAKNFEIETLGQTLERERAVRELQIATLEKNLAEKELTKKDLQIQSSTLESDAQLARLCALEWDLTGKKSQIQKLAEERDIKNSQIEHLLEKISRLKEELATKGSQQNNQIFSKANTSSNEDLAMIAKALLKDTPQNLNDITITGTDKLRNPKAFSENRESKIEGLFKAQLEYYFKKHINDLRTKLSRSGNLHTPVLPNLQLNLQLIAQTPLVNRFLLRKGYRVTVSVSGKISGGFESINIRKSEVTFSINNRGIPKMGLSYPELSYFMKSFIPILEEKMAQVANAKLH